MAFLSKYTTIDTPCKDYVHPWCDSCIEATMTMLPSCLQESFKIYTIAYTVALLMRGKFPSENELKGTIFGILQSTMFLSFHGVGYSSTLCLIRRLVGNFNFLSVSFIPKFIVSIIAILLERPSRRALLALYVTNVASETVFRMAVARKIVTPVRYGEVFVFAASVAYLLFYYKGPGLPKDPVYSLLRFLVGPYEERGYFKMEDYPYPPRIRDSHCKDTITRIITHAQNTWDELVYKIKTLGSQASCPHPFSCTHYILSGSIKTFSIGFGLQLALKIVMNLSKILRNPVHLKNVLCRRDNLRLGLCFASFSGLFRGVNCLLRRFLDKDSNFNAIPAGFIAGLAFFLYRDNTIALYFMWKTLQITYNTGVEKGILPSIPYGAVFFYAVSTSVLFHVAIVEPQNLRPSYWRFLEAMSGGRMGRMDRNCIDAFGLKSSESLSLVLERERLSGRGIDFRPLRLKK